MKINRRGRLLWPPRAVGAPPTAVEAGVSPEKDEKEMKLGHL
jgi:hypothetical protein